MAGLDVHLSIHGAGVSCLDRPTVGAHCLDGVEENSQI